MASSAPAAEPNGTSAVKAKESLPSSVADAVLVQGEMPAGSQKVEELDFNKLAGRPITVDELINPMSNMGFQASAIGDAVRIINDMASFLLPCTPPLPLHSPQIANHKTPQLTFPSEHGANPKPEKKQPSFSATPQI